MDMKAILFAAASILILAACSSTPSGPFFPKGRYDTQYCKNKTCEVTILDPGCDIFGTCTADVNYYTTILVSGNRGVDIYWNLPDGYGFCPEEGDGVYLKDVDSDDQFDKTGATGSDVSVGIKKCKSRFKWVGKNTTEFAKDYQYRIVFRGPFRGVQHVFVIDPWIVNGR